MALRCLLRLLVGHSYSLTPDASALGIDEKVSRAQEQFKTLEKEITAFVGANRYRARVAERNPQTGKYALRLIANGVADAPLKWAIDIGEIAHNLRSALNYIAFQNGDCHLDPALARKPPTALVREIGFPIHLYAAQRRGRPGIENRDVWSDSKPAKTWLTGEQWAVLERFQPYHRRKRKGWAPPAPTGKRNPLWHLQELNNADKHRLMQVTAHTARGFSCIVRRCPPTCKIGYISPKLGKRLKDGAYVGTIDIEGSLEGVDLDLTVYPEITFRSGCDAVKGLPVVTTLERILYHVEYDILVPLAKEFRPLDPPYGPLL